MFSWGNLWSKPLYEKGGFATIVHEIGHAVDHMLFDWISYSDEFIEICEEEARDVFSSKYYWNEPAEYFAEAFIVYNGKGRISVKDFKRRAPKTYKFFEELTEKAMTKE